MSSFATITPAELKQRLANGESLTMVDVREDEEVAHGMIPGAIHIPLGQLAERSAEIPDASEVIMICRSGGRSGKACEYLRSVGIEGVTNMTGGMLEWVKL